jgi:hypothetical protein
VKKCEFKKMMLISTLVRLFDRSFQPHLDQMKHRPIDSAPRKSVEFDVFARSTPTCTASLRESTTTTAGRRNIATSANMTPAKAATSIVQINFADLECGWRTCSASSLSC